jgi:hypothetical protein
MNAKPTVIATRSSAARAWSLTKSPTVLPMLAALEIDPAAVVWSVEPNPNSETKYDRFVITATVKAKPAVKRTTKQTVAA